VGKKVEYTDCAWKCPQCGAWRRVHRIYKCRGDVRRCACGFRVKVWCRAEQRTEYFVDLVKAADEG